MSAFVSLFKNDLKLFMKDWKAVLLLISLPVLFIMLFSYTLSGYINENEFIEPFDIAIVDNENTTQTRMLIRQLEEMDIFRKILLLTEDAAKEKLEENLISSIIIIPEDFTTSISQGINKPIKVIGNKLAPLDSYIVRNLVQSACNMVSSGQSAINAIYYYNKAAGLPESELIQEYNASTASILMDALARGNIFNRYEMAAGLDLTAFEYFTAALMTVFLMLAGLPGLKMLVTERDLGLFDRLKVSPVKTWQIIISKFLVTFILSAIQFSATLFITLFVFKNYWGTNVKNIIFIFAATLFSVSCWSMLVSSISRTPKAADLIGSLGILLMAIIGGNIYPLSSMPEIIQYLSKFTVNRWAMEGFMAIFSGNPALKVGNYVLPLLLLGVSMLSIAFVIYYAGRTVRE
ncbi:MAG TPA: ABC transporter permease [Clostridiaceae bacterium]|jgi:ABC-2 type transport system permease protein|nr:ABC transporter permease [Clostridiaceae bacterium]